MYIRSKIMRNYILLVFILFFSFSCAIAPQVQEVKENQKNGTVWKYHFYINHENQKVLHGTSETVLKNGLTIIENYADGQLDGLKTVIAKTYRKEEYFKNSEIQELKFFNKDGVLISSLSFLDGYPDNGTYWDFCYGSNGLKWSRILHFKRGNMVLEEECDENGAITEEKN